MTENTTVFNDNVSFDVKHPLKHRWTLWFDCPSKKSMQKDQWQENLKKVITFDTVEDFWGIFNNLTNAHELPPSANYHLFKEGIEPSWEDKANEKGGKWAFNLQRGKRGPELDQWWLNVCLGCIGEQFTFGEEITGCVVSIRKANDRISIWTREADDKEKCLKIGQEMKKILGVNDKLSFQSHHDSANKKTSAPVDRYVC
ncbi:translation initiation factor eIF 4e-like domain-containing protein [Gorgonomyces haynaldii]|nr:translation initiation factor eIF 4e-like domain-containing protein [Gorgonomyces haynaldii]